MDAINDWENQALTHRNRLAPHAYFMGYETADLAATYSRELSRGFVQLSGSWQFRLFEGLLPSPTRSSPRISLSGSRGGSAPVAGRRLWQPCLYRRGFPVSGGSAARSSDDPTGVYQRIVNLPAVPAGAREIIRFDGIESYGELYVNGQFIGMTKGSRLSAEFDVTDALVEGDNLFAIKVLQYSDGSYIEDQDMWWASGIFRDVYLMQRPAAHLVDFRFRTHREGDAALITLDTVAEGATRVVFTLSDGENVVATGECVDGHAECSVADAHFWNPEDPFLYDLTFEVYDGDEVSEYVPHRQGLAEVTVEGNHIYLNGTYFKMHGVNRHDHDDHKGRAVGLDRMRRDLELMGDTTSTRCAPLTMPMTRASTSCAMSMASCWSPRPIWRVTASRISAISPWSPTTRHGSRPTSTALSAW